MNNFLQKFIFEQATVRGESVQLHEVWQAIMAHHAYPLPVKRLLGELTAAATLLCANIKFEGTMIMQIHGDGPIQLLVVECDDQLNIRAMVKLGEATYIPTDISLSELINRRGQGRFMITLDPSNKPLGYTPYQGIVPIEGESIAQIIENYMKHSEQLDTKLWLAANDQMCCGLLLQRLPHTGGKLFSQNEEVIAEDPEETWQRAALLAHTLSYEELLNTPTPTLLHRLFWEESLQFFPPQKVQFTCSCSREKVGNMLRLLGKEEVSDAIASLGKLDIHCDFCGKLYLFDAVDCTQLFLAPENKVNTTDNSHTH